MPTKLRVVLDTNVIISGLISPKGPPAGIKDLLGLGEYKGTRIVSPDQFLTILNP